MFTCGKLVSITKNRAVAGNNKKYLTGWSKNKKFKNTQNSHKLCEYATVSHMPMKFDLIFV